MEKGTPPQPSSVFPLSALIAEDKGTHRDTQAHTCIHTIVLAGLWALPGVRTFCFLPLEKLLQSPRLTQLPHTALSSRLSCRSLLLLSHTHRHTHRHTHTHIHIHIHRGSDRSDGADGGLGGKGVDRKAQRAGLPLPWHWPRPLCRQAQGLGGMLVCARVCMFVCGVCVRMRERRSRKEERERSSFDVCRLFSLSREER